MMAWDARVFEKHARVSDDSLAPPGWGASPEGSRPFLDALDLETSATRRLWQSAETCLEQCGSLLSDLPGEPLRCLLTRPNTKL